ncbi:MAG: NADH-ubiquinone oxidoreductase-F iron-sulfur binding region domain-containing protein [Alphaproteobacteria bacterium]
MATDDKPVHKFHHPGAGRRRAVPHGKGRQVDQAALGEVRRVLGERPRGRDLLVEHLHLIQDEFKCLSGAHLAALAEEMRLSLAEVYEVATFYAHFDVTVDDDGRPADVTVRVCDSLSCELAGSADLLARLPEVLGASVRVVRAPCMGRCDLAPAVEVGHRHVDRADVETVSAIARSGETEPVVPNYPDLEAYRRGGGYRVLEQCRAGERALETVMDEMDNAGLRGLGGAGFPAARKWQFVRAEPRPRAVAVNADEGEPGTFKDRYYLESDPHRFFEGTLIAAWGVEADDVYIYLRDEYPAARAVLLRELERLEEAGLTGPPRVHLRRGAGAYICGEESAMIESIEGKRGLPRHRPPYVAQVGVFGRPTLVHNVETLYWIREILEDGADRFAGRGRRGHKGPRSYSVSGRVREPGVKLAPAGITVRELIDEFCGGMAPGHTFKAYLPGGASGGILPAALADVPLDFGTLEEHGCFVGSHAIVVLSEQDDMRAVALNLMRFFEDESCGQCTPCRVGTEKAVNLMSASRWDRELLGELSAAMRDASICGLGQAAPNPIESVLRYFPEEVGAAPASTG